MKKHSKQLEELESFRKQEQTARKQLENIEETRELENMEQTVRKELESFRRRSKPLERN